MSAGLETIQEKIVAGKLEEARKALAVTPETEENRPRVRFLRGFLEESAYHREEAVALYEQALAEEPRQREAAFRAAVLCDQYGDDWEALRLLERCVIGQERIPIHVLLNLALLYEERGRLSEAERYLKAVLEEHPNHERALFLLKSVESSGEMVFDDDRQGERERRSALLDQPLTDFELSVRARNCLRQMNLRTMGDLLRTSEAELLSYKNFGETSLSEIKALLTQRGLRLGQALPTIELPAAPSVNPPVRDTTSVLNKSVSELELSVRSRKCLQILGITTVGELAMRSESELLGTQNFGQTSLHEIQRQLAIYGLSLRA